MKKRICILCLLVCLLFLMGCGKENATPIQWELLTEQVFTLADGTPISLWTQLPFSNLRYYRLPDGTSLLTEEGPDGPDNTAVIGQEDFQALSQEAQSAVLAYYETQGLLYDTLRLCEEAYAEYRDCTESNTEFQSHLVRQSIVPTASSDRLLYFCTSLTIPLGGRHIDELRQSAVFDKQTGTQIPVTELFLHPEEAVDALLRASGLTDEVLLSEMAAAFQPEWFVMNPSGLELCFPAGSLTSEEGSWTVAIDIQDLEGILQPWALPASESTPS